MQQQDFQNRQKLILNSEIRLIEKQKKEAQEDLDRMEKARKTEFTQTTQEIKVLTFKRNQLLEEVERLRDSIGTLNDAYNKSKENIETFLKTHMELTKKDADKILTDAKEKEIITNNKLVEADSLLTQNQNTQKQLSFEHERLKLQQEEHRAAIIALDTQKEAQKKEDTNWEIRLNGLQKVKRELEESIAALQDSRKELDNYIVIHNREITARIEKAQQKEREAQVKMTEALQKEQVLSQKERKLNEENILLKDRQGQLERAIAEMRGKGVKI